MRLFRPQLDKQDLESIRKVFSRSWLGLGREVEKFENIFKKKIKVNFAIATNSGTSALNLALKCLNLKKNSYVMVNNLTFASSATCILNNNLNPMLIDCENQNLSMDIEDIKKKYKSKVSAIVIVHYGGHADKRFLDILKFAKNKKIKVIEDCAHSQLGKLGNKFLGTYGDIGCFSFEEKKGITTGDGGMLITNSKKINLLAKKIRWLGINKGTWDRTKKSHANKSLNNIYNWKYKINMLGDKLHMNDLSASLGISQIKKLIKINKKKNLLIKKYREKLNNVENLELLIKDFNPNLAYWLFGLRVKKREKLMKYLKQKNIPYGVHYIPLNKFKIFKSYGKNLKNCNKIEKQIITLPLHASLSLKKVIYICNTIKKINSKL